MTSLQTIPAQLDMQILATLDTRKLMHSQFRVSSDAAKHFLAFPSSIDICLHKISNFLTIRGALVKRELFYALRLVC